MSEFYIISTKWTSDKDNIFTLWSPNNSGYCQIIERAGIYAEDKTKLNEGILYVEKHIIDKLIKTVSGVYNDFGMETFSVLPNSGEVRKALGVTKYNLKEKGYSNKYFGLYFPSKIYELSKTITSEDEYHVKAKEYVDEFWYMDGVFKAENRNKAILEAYKEFAPADYESYLDFKKDVTCKKAKTIIFDKWDDEATNKKASK